MKAVLISIRPEWCDLISRGKKTLEVRKTRPKIVPTIGKLIMLIWITTKRQMRISYQKDGGKQWIFAKNFLPWMLM